MRRFLIDGYNLLAQIPEFAARGGENLESRRARLIRRLIGLSAGRRLKFHLVFDGPPPRHSGTTYPGVRVDFTAPSADDFLCEQLVAQAKNPTLIVVSTDLKDVISCAQAHGVSWMTCQNFWKWLVKSPTSDQPLAEARESAGLPPPGWCKSDDEELRSYFEEAVGKPR